MGRREGVAQWRRGTSEFLRRDVGSRREGGAVKGRRVAWAARREGCVCGRCAVVGLPVRPVGVLRTGRKGGERKRASVGRRLGGGRWGRLYEGGFMRADG